MSEEQELSRSVRVGENTYTLTRFRGYKATRIMREAAAIGRKWPKLAKTAAAFEREWAEDNVIVMSRAEAEFRYGSEGIDVSDEAWQQGGGEVRLHRAPPLEQRIAALFPEAMEYAERHVVTLLAIVSASNEELAEHYRSDTVDDFLKERSETLMLEGDAAELVELAVAGAELARGQFAPLGEKLSVLTKAFGLKLPTTKTMSTEPSESDSPETSRSESDGSPESEPIEMQAATTPETPSPSGSPSSSSSPTRPPSSIDSPPSTDGIPTSSSTESRGESSLASSPG